MNIQVPSVGIPFAQLSKSLDTYIISTLNFYKLFLSCLVLIRVRMKLLSQLLIVNAKKIEMGARSKDRRRIWKEIIRDHESQFQEEKEKCKLTS